MNGFGVVVCGGGVAAIEGVLRLRRLLGPGPRIDIVAPNEHFRQRAMAVMEPFSPGAMKDVPLASVAEAAGATLHRDTLDWIDSDQRVVHTGGGIALPFHAALVAVGARTLPPAPGVTPLSDSDPAGSFGRVVDEILDGRCRRVAFLAPRMPAWPLPLYELLLLTAHCAGDLAQSDLELSLITPEQRPLAAFGSRVSKVVSEALAAAGVHVHTAVDGVVHTPGRVAIGSAGELDVDRIVALPRLTGPIVSGLSAGAHGFIPVDRYCCVPRTRGSVFAAGDAVEFPVKHGGLGSQMADVASAAIAQLAGVNVDARPFSPVLRGKLLTGGEPLYIEARLVGGGSFDSRLFRTPPWEAGDKVIALELGNYLKRLPAAA